MSATVFDCTVFAIVLCPPKKKGILRKLDGDKLCKVSSKRFRIL